MILLNPPQIVWRRIFVSRSDRSTPFVPDFFTSKVARRPPRKLHTLMLKSGVPCNSCAGKPEKLGWFIWNVTDTPVPESRGFLVDLWKFFAEICLVWSLGWIFYDESKRIWSFRGYCNIFNDIFQSYFDLSGVTVGEDPAHLWYVKSLMKTTSAGGISNDLLITHHMDTPSSHNHGSGKK